MSVLSCCIPITGLCCTYPPIHGRYKLQENIKNWLAWQGHIRISLDIGTVLGLVLLLVYYTGEVGCTELAGCGLTLNIDREHCAEL